MAGEETARRPRRGRDPQGGRTPQGGRRRAAHSMEAVISEAVALLDEAGESALTFRALAARLGGGAASIYWYVANKDELLDRASDHVMGGVLADSEQFTDAPDPIDALRGIAVTLCDAIADRPWLGAYFMRDTEVQPHALALYERMGQQVLRLDLDPRQAFHAVSAVMGFVVGVAADLGQKPPPEVLDGTVTRDEYIGRFADQWRSLDPAEFPFVHRIADEFAHHDDQEQFRAGLDLLLAGLRLQAGG
ncbi:Tetracyclin repressor, C-terminal all-alpha domain [Nocardioides exalbidus]|uniref:Tetracyclin repressor, C-terminal all-alpha domain n=1 Tax=Nocardioides exalbidus TaxID=402596 RepID=A0A1H4VZQ4_9ACTN|nr:TetR/AcrR family transcriptional regulator [Nocardioides exalbidus]SEC86612.1 Tetracyclin repressor, C-terminal all-alpha domain [Nocardioides exalbidus]